MRSNGCKFRWNYLERRLSNLCKRYALIVSDYPLPFIIIPILITLIGSGGFAYRKLYNDVTELYVPQNAQSRMDQKTIAQYFPQKDGTYQPGKIVIYERECSVVILAKDGGNILRRENMNKGQRKDEFELNEAVERLNEFVMTKIVITDRGQNYTYQNLCMKAGTWCYNNPQIYVVARDVSQPQPPANASFPTATFRNGQRYYLGATLGGVRMDAGSKKITEAKAWLLTYKLKDNTSDENALSMKFEREFEKRLLSYDDGLLDIYPFHSQTLDLEVPRNCEALRPRFTLMLAMLVTFAILCTLTWSRPSAGKGKCTFPVVDWTISRPVLAAMGVLGAGMGVASAIGFLSFGGVFYNNVVDVMPFLIIAVRLDNTFLMIAALDNTKRGLSVRDRISEAMAESAVSITITVLTDIFSFAFGVLTDFVAVQLFCIYTTLAIILTWIYQLTFLLACLVYYARCEEKHMHSLLPCVPTVAMQEYESQSILTRLFCMGSRRSPPRDQSTNQDMKIPIDTSAKITSQLSCCEDEGGTSVSRWFRDTYGRILMMKPMKCLSIFLLLAFWAVSIYGCVNLREGLEPIRLLVDDSYAIPYYEYLEKYFWDYGQQVQVVIFNPGDLTDPYQRGNISNAVNAFAHLSHSTGREGIDFWMTALNESLHRDQGGQTLDALPSEKFYEKLNWFLNIKENFRYGIDVAFKNGTGPGDNDTNPVVAIRAMLGIKGFNTLTGQQETMDEFRKTALAYPKLNIRTFHMMFLFVDQYEDIWPNVAQEIYSSMACMIGISLLLIPHPICAIWVTFAILSIDVGVIGFMTLWGLNMDTISMITIIMSIGFSVDFSAHIAYAYVTNIHEEPDQRVRKALGNLGWPVLQGGVATILGVIFLADLNSYMVKAFFKTVFLVIVFGLMHGLIFLPVLLNLLMPKRMCVAAEADHHDQPIQNGHAAPAGDSVAEKQGKSEIWKTWMSKMRFRKGQTETVKN